MKSNWQTKKIGEILKLEYGKPLKDRKSDGLYPVYGANGIKDYSNKFYFDKPSIIVGRKGSAGEVNLTTEKFWPLDVTYFVTYDDKKYDLKYLFNLLKSLQLPKLAKGVKPGINRNDVYAIRVNIPPLSEQQRIVKILDDVFEKIAKAKENTEKNLQNTKELFESNLQSVLISAGNNWEKKRLKEIGITQTGTTPKTSEKENYGNFIPFIKPADVDFSGVGDIRYDNDGLSEVGLKKGRKMEKGSILMVCIGATIGKVGFSEQLVSCNQQINSLTVKDDYEPKFFYYAMTSKEFQKKVLFEGKGAQATLPIINKSKWENLTINYPVSKIEQKAIVAKLDLLSEQTKKLVSIYERKIRNLEELKKSILKQAFSGEL